MTDATSRAREMVMQIINDHYNTAEHMDAAPLADALLYDIARYHWALIDTRTHTVIAREPSEAMVERVGQAIFLCGPDITYRDQARVAIAALTAMQTQGGDDDPPV